MPSNEEDDRYDTFEEYTYNYNMLETIYRSIDSTDFNEFSSNAVNESMENGRYIIKDCITLKKYLTHFGSIDSCGSKNCCAYINYKLNKNDRDYNIPGKSSFSIYNTYINTDNFLNKKNICETKIKYISSGNYEKISELYNLYYLFHQFNSYKDYGLSQCSLARNCAERYNVIVGKYQATEDIKFCNVLEDFKKRFQRDDWISQNKCSNISSNLLQLGNSCVQLQEKTAKTGASLEPQEKASGTGKSFEESSDPVEGETTLEITEQHPVSPSSLGSTLPITLFSSGIGTLLILLSFYKFTALGQFLRLSTQKFKGIPKNIDGEDYEMQQHTYGYDKENSEYNEYNISYNSL
ncbi:PIR Superfamily Protein [Plasmodium ovale wallikeri]|uniref:PIR Superfamily Protein n=1 Tax=Plasmodium ovale wallikeri TaxID=864142 RepID=A0A1A9AIG0_PLAOA|nr:PIR Superfamily Protein [Plasmodium ovale wallikeri]